MANTDHDINVLNTLIKTILDSRKGFLDAAEDAKSTEFAAFFADFAGRREQAAAILQNEVRRLGGSAEDEASFLGAAHRTFLNIKQLFVDRDDKAIINEVERGEDYIKEKFDIALSDGKVSSSTRSVIENAYISVREGHDRASAMKHSMMQ